MPTTLNHVLSNSQWLTSSIVPVLAGPSGTVVVNSISVPVSTLINDPAYKGKTILLMASQELQANIKNIQDIISLNQQIQKVLLSKIHGSVLNADHSMNGGTASFEEYAKALFAKNPQLANSLVLTDPIPGVLPLNPANQFSQYLDSTQLLTKDGAPLKGKLVKLDKALGDGYYYMDYPSFKIIEALHQAFLADTTKNQSIDLSFVNELRFARSADNIEINMNRTDNMLTALDSTNIATLKNAQLSGLKKITISNLDGNVRIVKGAFAGYNFQSLTAIEFKNIAGSVLIDEGAFSNTNMPRLQSITFDDIGQGLVLKDGAFSGSIMPNFTSLIIAQVQGELTVGNNVFPANLMTQVNNMVFQSNTGRISILDTTLKNLIKFGFDQLTQGGGYQVYGDDLKWIKGKLSTLEALIRGGFRGVLPAASTYACCNDDSSPSISSIVSLPKPLSAEDKNILRLCQDGQIHDAQIFTSIIFFGVSGFLLYYVGRKQFFQ